jgi:hypothetical protein
MDEIRIIVRLPSRTFVGSRRELMRRSGIGLLVVSPPKLKIPRPSSPKGDEQPLELIRSFWLVHSGKERTMWWVYRPKAAEVQGTVIDQVPESWVAYQLEETFGFAPIDRRDVDRAYRF